MKKRILALEKISRRLESTPAERARWTKKANKYAANFLAQLPDLQAFSPLGDKSLELENHPVGLDEPLEMDAALDLIARQVDGVGLKPASAGHLGYIPGGGLYPTALGDYLAAVGNAYAGLFFAHPGSVRIENMVVRWMCKMVGYPATAHGTLTSGGSIANLAAFATGRDAMKIKARDIEKTVIYLTKQVLEQRGMLAADLRELLGSRQRAHDVMRKKRRLTLPQIRLLNEKLKVPAEVLIRDYALTGH